MQTSKFLIVALFLGLLSLQSCTKSTSTESELLNSQFVGRIQMSYTDGSSDFISQEYKVDLEQSDDNQVELRDISGLANFKSKTIKLTDKEGLIIGTWKNKEVLKFDKTNYHLVLNIKDKDTSLNFDNQID